MAINSGEQPLCLCTISQQDLPSTSPRNLSICPFLTINSARSCIQLLLPHLQCGSWSTSLFQLITHWILTLLIFYKLHWPPSLQYKKLYRLSQLSAYCRSLQTTSTYNSLIYPHWTTAQLHSSPWTTTDTYYYLVQTLFTCKIL